MAAFLFTCPVTGMKVHGWAADEQPQRPYYEAVQCTACGRVHFINPQTGQAVGSKDESLDS
jgi:hypothetical protein